MTLLGNPWFDLSSLQLSETGWEHVRSPVDFESVSEGRSDLREFGPQGRYIADLRVWMNDSSWRIEFTPKGDPRIGCRGLGAVLARLVQEAGVAQVPPHLFLRARESQFLVRSLLSVWPLGSAARRKEILGRHTLVRCPKEPEEGHQAYEKRAVQLVDSRLEGYEQLEPSNLRLKDVQSLPDGLFYKEDEGKLVIVEAKMNRADWADGAAQVLQYIGQARNHSRFSRADISTYLVAVDDEPTEQYRAWEKLMGANREFNVYVDATCLR